MCVKDGIESPGCIVLEAIDWENSFDFATE